MCCHFAPRPLPVDSINPSDFIARSTSRTMSLRTHQPFESAEKAVKDNLDIISQKNILETENHRILVEDTDEGEVLRERVHDLKQLVAAYQLGWITETRCEDHIW